jgi:hypothetical protein
MVGELTERAIAREKARDVNETRTLDYWKSQRERIQYLNVLNALGVPRLGLFYV